MADFEFGSGAPLEDVPATSVHEPDDVDEHKLDAVEVAAQGCEDEV